MANIAFEKVFAICQFESDGHAEVVPTKWLKETEDSNAVDCCWPLVSRSGKSVSSLAVSNTDPTLFKWQLERVTRIFAYEGKRNPTDFIFIFTIRPVFLIN